MRTQYHILNGDALKERFPEHIADEILVVRECLVDGDVHGEDLEDLFVTRSRFISENYEGCNENEYYQKSVSEFEKMKHIPTNSEINLWFEDDLFCQVNFWFVIKLLNENHRNQFVYLIRPKTGNDYSFGAMSESDLISAFQNKIKIELFEVQKLGDLWSLYQNDDCEKMLEIAKELEDKYPFLMPVIKAHIDRFPNDGNLGRPTQSLITIMEALQTDEFGPIFREFCKQESIYGFGNLQVKRIVDDIISNR